ncbi:protein kinase domain-containing protein [Phlyctema vagabunda]|uniref:Protein kinase domain-containing protein n=1 Tax=Phlyctema vagabunda TaxID=108571 RepID=A0ABR4PB57_9HELO
MSFPPPETYPFTFSSAPPAGMYLAPVLEHPSWSSESETKPNVKDSVEDESRYTEDGLLPILLGQLFQNERYQVIHKLGIGGEATVWAVHDRHRPGYAAMKVLSASATARSQDIQILERLRRGPDHPGAQFICHVFDHFFVDGPLGRHLCLMSPLLGPRVLDALDGLAPDRSNQAFWDLTRKLMKQTVQGLAFLHSRSVIHGGNIPRTLLSTTTDLLDFTPFNILVVMRGLNHLSLDQLYNEVIGTPHKVRVSSQDARMPEYLVARARFRKDIVPFMEKEIRIIDFGLAYFADQAVAIWGTPANYAAPELMVLELPSMRADLWALSCTVFEICFDFILFDGDTMSEVLANIIKIFGIIPGSLCGARGNIKLLEMCPEIVARVGRGEPVQEESFESIVYLQFPIGFTRENVHEHTSSRGPDLVDFLRQGLNYVANSRTPAARLVSHPWLNPVGGN